MKNKLLTLKNRIRPYRMAQLSVMVGIFAVLLVSAVSYSGGQLIEKEMENLGMDSMLLAAGDGQALQLTEQVYRSVSGVAGLEISTPVVMDTGSCRFENAQETQVMFWGINSRADSIIALEMLHGSLFDPQQVTEGQLVCVVDANLAQQAYGTTDITGKTVQLVINGISRSFTVIGVAQTGSGLLKSVSGSLLPDFVYLPYTTLSSFCAKNGYDRIAFKPLLQADARQVSDDAVKAAAAFSQNGQQGVILQDLFGQRDTVIRLVDAASAALALIAGTALLVSGISVMSAAFGAVRRRRREIGIKKSMGAPMGQIMAEFMTDALLSTVSATALGLLAGGGGLLAGQRLLGLPVGHNLLLVSGGCAAMLVIGLCFAFIPALQAARMRPADALREWE